MEGNVRSLRSRHNPASAARPFPDVIGRPLKPVGRPEPAVRAFP